MHAGNTQHTPLTVTLPRRNNIAFKLDDGDAIRVTGTEPYTLKLKERDRASSGTRTPAAGSFGGRTHVRSPRDGDGEGEDEGHKGCEGKR